MTEGMNAEQVKKAFNEDRKTNDQFGELVALDKRGWREQCPEPYYWRHRHPDFPEWEVHWTPGNPNVNVVRLHKGGF